MTTQPQQEHAEEYSMGGYHEAATVARLIHARVSGLMTHVPSSITILRSVLRGEGREKNVCMWKAHNLLLNA